MTVRQYPGVIQALTDQFGGHPRFVLETDVTRSASLCASALMISDYSGAALEYAFVYERPVLFVNVPRKINNPDYEQIGCEPLEVCIRERIGELVWPSNLHQVPGIIGRLCRDPGAWSQRIRRVRSETVFNIGRSASVGASHIARLADEVGKAEHATHHPARQTSPAHA